MLLIIDTFPQGWKKERIIRRYNLGRYVIVIHPSDPAYCWNKVYSVLKNVVDNELGFSEIGIRNLDATKVIRLTQMFFNRESPSSNLMKFNLVLLVLKWLLFHFFDLLKRINDGFSLTFNFETTLF